MLYYALLFFVVAVIAALLGMRGVAGLSADVGYLLVFVSLVLVVIAFLANRAPGLGP